MFTSFANPAHDATFLLDLIEEASSTRRIGIIERKRQINKKRARRFLLFESATSAFTSVLNVDERMRTRDLLKYDTDSATMVCDISANVHICNKENMFVGEMRKCTNHGVATIGGKGHRPSGIGTVRWIWRDDAGKSHADTIYCSALKNPIET